MFPNIMSAIDQIDSLQQAYQKQRQIVTELFVSKNDTYNLRQGGLGFNSKRASMIAKGRIVVKDVSNGSVLSVYKNDKRWLNGQLVGHTKGMKTVITNEGKTLSVPVTDNRYHGLNYNKVVVRCQNGNKQISRDSYRSGQYISVSSGKTTFKDLNGNIIQTKINDDRVLSGELVGITTGMVTVKDKDGNILSVSKNDPRYISGQLVGIRRKITTVYNQFGEKINISIQDEEYKSGKYKNINKGISRNTGKTNPNYGKFKDRGLRYIKSIYLNKQKVIKIQDEIPQGWSIGRLSKPRKSKHKCK